MDIGVLTSCRAAARRLSRSGLVAGLLILAATSASAGPPVIAMRLDPVAHIEDGGFAVRIGGHATCAAGLLLFEAFVTISQEPVSGDIGPFGIPCDGKWHRWRTVVPTFDPPPYQRGEAFASGFMLAEDEEGTNQYSAGHSRQVRLIRSRR